MTIKKYLVQLTWVNIFSKLVLLITNVFCYDMFSKMSIPRVLPESVPNASNSSKHRKSSVIAQIKNRTCAESVLSVDSSNAMEKYIFSSLIILQNCCFIFVANSFCRSVMVPLKEVLKEDKKQESSKM
ncbi:hypothetical protein LAZ67_1007241 [Cordylochernes scorpioides]|uniref:ATP synthase F0 subunit 8 n=1 Tax=Cordylochernes scorpioides TaxID=51811 RepID=A0ABY6JZ64_9ARAC|nr:hypothetical protein LAZ67_1007241 [Cordylochernes scorpioides]